jgi:betaine-aldehyde dehydrogenase
VSDRNPRELRNFIGGEFVPASAPERDEVIDPATGDVVASAPISTAADVDAACRAAAGAFGPWRDTPVGQRQAALLNIAQEIEDRAEELAELEVRDTGKPRVPTAADELPSIVDHLRFVAGAARCLDGVPAGEYLEGHTSWLRREPVGVVAAIAPWNYPLMMAVWKMAPALAMGNTMVLKPARETPLTTLALAELASEHLPCGVFNVVTGGARTGQDLVCHPAPAMVALTGSVAAGRDVAAAAARNLKRVHLELGGKAPVVVLDDVDVAEVASRIAEAGYFNAGQDCTAATRILVHRRIHRDLIDALADEARRTRIGLPQDGDTQLGPLISLGQRERVEGFLDRLPPNATVVTGGGRPEQLAGGFFLEPAVVSGSAQLDEAIQEEIFGPVLTVQPFEDEAQAVELANGVRYGLAASVWTKDLAAALRLTKALDFGCVWVNAHLPVVAEMPHGGVKESGYGSDLSVGGLREYTRTKHVMACLE